MREWRVYSNGKAGKDRGVLISWPYLKEREAQLWIDENQANLSNPEHTFFGATLELTEFETRSERIEREHQTMEQQLADMAMLIRQLSLALRKAAPAHTLPDRAMDYLKRKNLQGSILRAKTDVTPVSPRQTIPPQATLPDEATDSLCQCRKCLIERNERVVGMPVHLTRMILCPICGNKRCPHATDHTFVCTHSNDPGQSGSAFE